VGLRRVPRPRNRLEPRRTGSTRSPRRWPALRSCQGRGAHRPRGARCRRAGERGARRRSSPPGAGSRATLREASAIPEPEVVQQEERGHRGGRGARSRAERDRVDRRLGSCAGHARRAPVWTRGPVVGPRAPHRPRAVPRHPTIQGPSRASPPPPSERLQPAGRRRQPRLPSCCGSGGRGGRASPVDGGADRDRRPGAAWPLRPSRARPRLPRRRRSTTPRTAPSGCGNDLRGVREHPRPNRCPPAWPGAARSRRGAHRAAAGGAHQVKQHNAALQHDLDVARRAAEARDRGGPRKGGGGPPARGTDGGPRWAAVGAGARAAVGRGGARTKR
jgi:hypothetical protein